MAQFINAFSWSQSRDKMFKECKRKYYYHYYASWGGWNYNAPKETKRIYLLKQLKNRQMWVGEVVHEQIEHLIRLCRCKLDTPEPSRLLEETRNRLRREFASSRCGDYLSMPKKCALFEHHYNIEVSPQQWRDNADNADVCLSNFMGSGIYKKIVALPDEDFLESEEFSSFLFDGFKINVKLDFSYKEDDWYLIYDWKTGKSSSDENNLVQLACYALYASDKWRVLPGRIKTVVFNLQENRLFPYPVTREMIESSQEYIKDSIREMKERLRDSKENIAMEADFERTSSEYLCNYCNFKEVCE